MAIQQSDIEYYLNQLRVFGEVRAKRMFGGVGFFHQDLMFAMMDGDGIFRLKVEDENRADFESRGMDRFRMGKGSLPYYEVPEDVYSDPELLAVWAQKAFAVALQGKRKK